VLRRQNPLALQRFLAESAARFGNEHEVSSLEQKSEDEMRELMHRMIVARTDLTDLHRASREWLFKNGIDSYGAEGALRN
jgi:hypothetical protein